MLAGTAEPGRGLYHYAKKGSGMQRLLVRATNWIGDAIMSIPALRAIRRAHAGWQITILALPWVAGLYEGEGFCDEVLVYRRDGDHRGLRGRARLARELRSRRFDRAILLQNAFDAAWLAWRARVPERIGYDRDGRGLLLTDRVPVPTLGEIPEHQRFYYLELLRRARLIERVPADTAARFDRIDALRRNGAARWQGRGLSPGPWIGVSPGAAFGSAKRWPAERFASAAADLAEELGTGIAVFGSEAELPLAAEVAARAGKRSICLAGQTSLPEFLELASTCRLFLTNDSGSMHVAAALGVPTVAVFGATNADATGPAAPSARIVRHPVDCSPCLLRECPIEGHPCMAGVEPKMVVSEARSLLAGLGDAA